jgi:hypothetical protein
MAAVFALIGAATPLRAQTRWPVPGEPAVYGAVCPAGGREQVITQPAGPAPTPRHTGIKAMVKDLGSDFKHLPSKENLFWAGIGGGLALAVHPADDNVNESLVNSDFAHNFFKAGEVLGELPTLLASAATVYAVGRLKDKPKVSHVGMDLIESLIVSEAMVQPLKYATRRERPDGSGKNSFPSGHAADTFAFATALERHLGWKGAVPAYLLVVCRDLPIAREPPLAERCRVWRQRRHHRGRTVTRHGKTFPSRWSRPGGAPIRPQRRRPMTPGFTGCDAGCSRGHHHWPAGTRRSAAPAR